MILHSRLLIFAAGLALFSATWQHATAQDIWKDVWSGNYWLPKCSNESDALCAGFMTGMDDFNSVLGQSEKKYCEPGFVTLGQKRQVIVKELRDNPATLHEPFIGLALKALGKAFPCR